MNRPKWSSESGLALVVVLLMMLLVAALMAGFVATVMSEHRQQQSDADRVGSFYGAHGGLEKLTSDLGDLFSATYTPTAAQITALNGQPPVIPGVTFVNTSDGPGYGITFTSGPGGNPAATSRTITTGPFQGFTGLVTSYVIGVTARTGSLGESRLQREIQTVAIPLFQFGQFSDTDVGFHPGVDFDFGGRVHTNGNLFLAAGNTLTISDKISAVGEVIRTHLMNGAPTAGNWAGNVRVLTAPGAYRNLATNEGSLVNTLGSAQNEPLWSNLSIGTYHGYITNGRTGARRLDLPVVETGHSAIELIRRPQVGEATGAGVFLQRYFSMASLRILLSDSAAEITSLPTVTGTAPVQLGTAEPAGYTVDANRPHFAQSPATTSGTDYEIGPNEPLLGGYLKIEKQVTPGVWQDVTLEILNLGIAGKNPQRGGCTDPSQNAVIRLQRLINNSGSCGPANLTPGTAYWPMVLYDPREALRRENESTSNTSTVYLSGVMHYIELDVRNLTRWFEGHLGTSGTQVDATTGYTVYFSDRRGNKNASGQETGEFGFEDFVNPASSSGTPNGVLDAGEDVNGNGILDTYGQNPVNIQGVTWQSGSVLSGSARPWTAVPVGVAQRNPARFFRRALKVVNGPMNQIVAPGLTIAAENPVYLQGNYNANNGSGNPSVACSIAADAVTMLSNNWSDYTNFRYPHSAGNRPASNTVYRVAILAGKGRPFPRPTAGSVPTDFGSDGGTHNFLRMIEGWGSNRTLNYRGSMATLYFSRQATGVYKCCSNTYNPPTRDYRFDQDFLQPSLLPPRTPMFRDINAIGFFPVLTAPR